MASAGHAGWRPSRCLIVTLQNVYIAQSSCTASLYALEFRVERFRGFRLGLGALAFVGWKLGAS